MRVGTSLLQLMAKLRCPECQRTLSSFNLAGVVTMTDARKLQQQLAIAAQDCLAAWADSSAAVQALFEVRRCCD
jgi:hypothetical protein